MAQPKISRLSFIVGCAEVFVIVVLSSFLAEWVQL